LGHIWDTCLELIGEAAMRSPSQDDKLYRGY